MSDDKIKEVITNLRSCDDYHGNIEHDTFDNAIEAIERLIKERDEARREVCNSIVRVALKALRQTVAEDRGWDCFEKETQ